MADEPIGVFQAIAARRETRGYRPDPVPDDVVRRILQAGRVSGSATNRQPWRFVVVRSRELLDELAPTAWNPHNLLTAPLLIVMLVDDHWTASFDGGRAAQNMLLTAWSEGVGGCPNSFRDAEAARRLLGAAPEQQLLTALSLGYPLRRRRLRSAEEHLARAKRLPLDELVQAWL